MPPPLYNELESTGPPHSRTFRISVSVGNEIAEGSGFTKKQAKADAASRMFQRLNPPSIQPDSCNASIFTPTEPLQRVPSTSPSHGIVKPIQPIMPFNRDLNPALTTPKTPAELTHVASGVSEMTPLDMSQNYPPGFTSIIPAPEKNIHHCFFMKLDQSYQPNGFKPNPFIKGLAVDHETSDHGVSDLSSNVDETGSSNCVPPSNVGLPRTNGFTTISNPIFPTYDPSGELISKNPVSQLQELCAKHGFKLPVYIDKDADGPSHNRIFTVEVKAAQLTGIGVATTKKEAKRKAAEQALASVESILQQLTHKSSR